MIKEKQYSCRVHAKELRITDEPISNNRCSFFMGNKKRKQWLKFLTFLDVSSTDA